VLAGAVEEGTWKRKGKIGWAVEHQWIIAMLGKYWIEVQREQERLATVGSRGGGGPVRDQARERENATA
jgi:hypothetical protein